jgi:hypothetical protein
MPGFGSAANPYVEMPFERITEVGWGGGPYLLLKVTDPGGNAFQFFALLSKTPPSAHHAVGAAGAFVWAFSPGQLIFQAFALNTIIDLEPADPGILGLHLKIWPSFAVWDSAASNAVDMTPPGEVYDQTRDLDIRGLTVIPTPFFIGGPGLGSAPFWNGFGSGVDLLDHTGFLILP